MGQSMILIFQSTSIFYTNLRILTVCLANFEWAFALFSIIKMLCMELTSLFIIHFVHTDLGLFIFSIRSRSNSYMNTSGSASLSCSLAIPDF